MPTQTADAVQVARDLTSLAQWIRTEHVRLVGGEPLIHPDIAAILRAIRSSAISTRSRIITNGLALLDQSADFWETITEVHISIYPNTRKFHERRRMDIVQIAKDTDTVLVYKTFDYFRKAFRPISDDTDLTEAIYRTCQIANRWRCLTVDSGFIYRCPQSALPTLESRPGRDSDRLRIESIASRDVLDAWITGPAPLNACRGCSGSVGQLHPHRQLRRIDASSAIGEIDLDYLAELIGNPNAPNSCVTREEEIL